LTTKVVGVERAAEPVEEALEGVELVQLIGGRPVADASLRKSR
jgi:hypothetical protein